MTPLIELVDVTKTYRSGELEVEVLHGISLQVYAGEYLAIMGASGSGKTTLMNILGCLDRPSSGSYRFMGEDVSGFERDELARLRREAFGFVFQSYNLIGTVSALENVEVPAVYSGMAPAARDARAKELLGSLGLGDRLAHRPSQLSGGQQQRVSIARALMNGGRIVLADEPTGALDSKSGTEVMALLHDLSRQGHTVILITHAQEVAAQAQRIIEIRDGAIVGDPGPRQPAGPAAPETAPRADEGGASLVGGALEAAKTALRALHANLFRTVLTLLGIVIGVASVIAMLAIGDGAKQMVLDRISAMGTNLLLIRPGAPGRHGVGGTVASLVPEDADMIAALPNVLAAVPELGGSVTARSAISTTSPGPGPRPFRWRATGAGRQGKFFSPRSDELRRGGGARPDRRGQAVCAGRRPPRAIHRAQQRHVPGDRPDDGARRRAARPGPGRRGVGAAHDRGAAAVRAELPAHHHGGGGRRRAHRRHAGRSHRPPEARHRSTDFRMRNMASILETATERRTRSRYCWGRSRRSRCWWAASG